MAMIFTRPKNCLLSRLKALTPLQRFNHTVIEPQLYPEMGSDSVSLQGGIDMKKWKKVDARLFGITRSMIPQSSWTVLKILRGEGFDAYLVGGCVRDLVLHRIPKDFDIITTANLKQIRKKFYRAQIVGRRFPICLVNVKGSVIEVSSFETVAQHSGKKEKVQMPSGCDKRDFIRWRNSLGRDFTINSLFFDPFLNKIYDYANGMADLRSLKLRTLIPAQLSFKEDCARILRGLRIAARLGLSFSKDTEIAIRDLSSSILHLAKSRLMMELNYMLSYGAAEPSLCLLRRFNLLESLLPFHAAYLDQQTSKKSAQSSIMLMKLFFNLDKLVTCDRPSDCSLWVGLLAFHLALVNNPQDALVIWAFASVLYHGKWKDGIKFAREHAKGRVKFVPEISGFSEVKSDEELAKEVSQLASLVQDSVGALTEAESLSESTSRDPAFPCSGVVFVPKKTGKDTVQIFDLLVNNIESYEYGRQSSMIDYYLLGNGDPQETRFVLGKIVLETMSDGLVGGAGEVVKEENNMQTEDIEENCHPTPSDLEKHQIVVKNDKKRGLSSPNPEIKQEMAKKQKLVEKNCSLSEQEIAMKEPEIILEKGFQEKTKKYKKEVETCHLLKEEINVMKGNMMEKDLCHLLQQEISVERQEVVENEKYQGRAKKHMKSVETVEQHVSQDMATKKQLKIFAKGNNRQDELEKLLDKKDSDLLVEKVITEKTNKHKQKLIKEKSSRPPLSSLFKG